MSKKDISCCPGYAEKYTAFGTSSHTKTCDRPRLPGWQPMASTKREIGSLIEDGGKAYRWTKASGGHMGYEEIPWPQIRAMVKPGTAEDVNWDE